MITLVTGSNGQLGKTLNSITENNKQFIYLDKDELDITKENKLQEVIAKEYELESLGGQAAAAAHSLGTPLATIAVVAKELKKIITL